MGLEDPHEAPLAGVSFFEEIWVHLKPSEGLGQRAAKGGQGEPCLDILLPVRMPPEARVCE